MVMKTGKKELKKAEIMKEELSKKIRQLQESDITEKEISNIAPKLKNFIKAGMVKSNFNKVIEMLIMKKPFKHQFLKTGFRKIPRLLAEYGIQTHMEMPQFSRQAESPEIYGFQFPRIAVDPTGKWVAQAGIISSQHIYRIEFYELKDKGVDYHHVVELRIKGDLPTIMSNNRIKGLTFSPDGLILWISAGNKPNQGPFRTWIIKLNTMDWTHETFGPVFAYEYFNSLYSRSHFYNIKAINDDGIEKIIAPIPTYRNMLCIFDSENQYDIEVWDVIAKLAGFPNYFTRFSDITIIGNWIYAAGWAENAASDGIPNPRASLTILNLNDRKVEYGPYIVPEMMGHYDILTNTIWPLRIRPTLDGSGVYMIAENLAPKNSGGITPDHSGFVYIDLPTKDIWVRDTFPHETEEIRLQLVRDVIEFANGTYILVLKRDNAYNVWHGVIKLDEDLNPSEARKPVPDDWWNQIYVERHPTRPQDVILSAVRSIYNPNNPSGLIALWETF